MLLGETNNDRRNRGKGSSVLLSCCIHSLLFLDRAKRSTRFFGVSRAIVRTVRSVPTIYHTFFASFLNGVVHGFSVPVQYEPRDKMRNIFLGYPLRSPHPLFKCQYIGEAFPTMVGRMKTPRPKRRYCAFSYGA